MKSLQWRLTLSYVLLTILTVSAVGIVSLYLFKNFTERQERQYLSEIAEKMEGHIRRVFPYSSREKPELEAIADAARLLGNINVKIRGKDNQIIVESNARISLPVGNIEDDFPLLNEILNRRVLGGKVGGRAETDSGSKESTDGQIVRIPIGGPSAPYGYLELSQSSESREQALRTARTAVLSAALGAGLIAVAVSLFMGQRLTHPLRSLTAAVQSVGKRRFDSRVPDYGSDEIGRLAEQFNIMTDRLQQSYQELTRERDTLKKFIQDASHQLRTPLTALSTFHELMQKKIEGKNSDYKEFLEDSRQQIEKLGWIIQNLLDLSRIESGISAINKESCSCSELIESAWNGVKRRGEEKKITLRTDISDDLTLLCDRRRMEMALGNIFDNAVTYSPAESTISVSCRSDETRDLITVKDNGPGIPEMDAQRIFDRFYRGPESRGEGSGLGLSIVKSIVDAHGGSVRLDSLNPDGASLSIRLPRG
jgi:signal transduction histidine kinase